MKKRILLISLTTLLALVFIGCSSPEQKALNIVKNSYPEEYPSKNIETAVSESIIDLKHTISTNNNVDYFVTFEGNLNSAQLARLLYNDECFKDFKSNYENEDAFVASVENSVGKDSNPYVRYTFKTNLNTEQVSIYGFSIEGEEMDIEHNTEEFNIVKPYILSLLFGDFKMILKLLIYSF